MYSQDLHFEMLKYIFQKIYLCLQMWLKRFVTYLLDLTKLVLHRVLR